MKIYLSLLLLFIASFTFSQTSDKPFIRLVQPSKENNKVTSYSNFIIGSTCKTCRITINAKPVKVYTTGAFAIELNLKQGDTSFTILSNISGKSVSKKINYTYTLPRLAAPVKMLDIESIETYPEGNLIVQPGDKIKFTIKALTHCVANAMKDTRLFEMPLNLTRGMPGIYQGEYIVKAADSFAMLKIPITITDSLNNKITKETKNSFSVMSPNPYSK